MSSHGPNGSDQPPSFITKILIPRRRQDVLSRPRLIEFLNRHVERKLLLVCAPAGYGKTTLLADFAQQTGSAVCWYSLGSSDADPQVFLEYLVGAIRRRFPHFGERTGRYLQTAGAKDLEVAVGVLVSEMHEAIDEHVVLVLDDVHTIDEQPAIQALLNLLLDGLPANCCCVLASRTIPRIRLSRLVANREAAGLGVADLRFTATEIKRLFSSHYDLLIPDAQAEELADQSEGWITGIILTSHTLWQGLVKEMIQARFAGEPVFDYLAHEVFEWQTDEVRHFLLATSILPRLSPERCDTLLGRTDSAETLRDLSESHLFLFRLEGDDVWYRYHALFQEFLQTQLRKLDPLRFAQLHRKAGELAELEQDVDAAIDHYLCANDAERATSLVARVAREMNDRGRIQSLLRWCERLPVDQLAARPQLQIERARAAFEAGDLSLVQSALEAALIAANRQRDRRVSASVRIWQAIPLRSQGRTQEAIAACREGLAVAEEVGDIELIALGAKQLGLGLLAEGVTAEAISALERALDCYIRLADPYNEAVVRHNLGHAWKRSGDLQRGRRLLDQACERWREIGNTGMLAATLIALGDLYSDSGESEEALRALAEAKRAAQESGHLRLAGYAIATIADINRDRGDFATAQANYEESLAIAERVTDQFLQIAILDGLGRCHLFAGNPTLAHTPIMRARQLASERNSIYERGLCEDTYGVWCQEVGLLDQALDAFDRATEWLGASGAVRELSRARLHLARAKLQVGDRSRAVELAHAALAQLSAGASDPLLAAEGAILANVLDAAQAGGPPWLSEVLKRIGPAPRVEVEKPPLIAVPGRSDQRAVRCYTLGRIGVEIDGRMLDAGEWVTLKARELWFYLLANGPVPRDQLIEALWPDVEIGRGQSALHTAMYRLRRTLFPECVERHGDLWGVSRALALSVDDREFEQLAEGARQPTRAPLTPERAMMATQAVALYRGPYLAGLDAEWSDRRRQRLQSLYVRLLHDLIDQARQSGQHEQVIAYAELSLQIDPDNEAIHEALMRSHVLLGNRSAALRHYHRYVQQLRDELDAEPSRRLRLLSEQFAREG